MEPKVPGVKCEQDFWSGATYIRDMFGKSISERPDEACAFGPYGGSAPRLSDREIRQALNGLFQAGAFTGTDLLVEEVECWRGYVRADYLCVRDDHLAVIEIKSDCDTLSRFDEQVRVYSAIADRVTLVVGWTLAARALRRAPAWWQVLLVERSEDSNPRFVMMRDGYRNHAVDATALLSMLPITDLRALATDVGIRGRFPARQLRELVALHASDSNVRHAVRRWLTRIADQRRTAQA